jgi:hypothetical protein
MSHYFRMERYLMQPRRFGAPATGLLPPQALLDGTGDEELPEHVMPPVLITRKGSDEGGRWVEGQRSRLVPADGMVAQDLPGLPVEEVEAR